MRQKRSNTSACAGARSCARCNAGSGDEHRADACSIVDVFDDPIDINIADHVVDVIYDVPGFDEIRLDEIRLDEAHCDESGRRGQQGRCHRRGKREQESLAASEALIFCEVEKGPALAGFF